MPDMHVEFMFQEESPRIEVGTTFTELSVEVIKLSDQAIASKENDSDTFKTPLNSDWAKTKESAMHTQASEPQIELPVSALRERSRRRDKERPTLN